MVNTRFSHHCDMGRHCHCHVELDVKVRHIVRPDYRPDDRGCVLPVARFLQLFGGTEFSSFNLKTLQLIHIFVTHASIRVIAAGVSTWRGYEDMYRYVSSMVHRTIDSNDSWQTIQHGYLCHCNANNFFSQQYWIILFIDLTSTIVY